MIDETERRRKKQLEYNKKNNINPKTIYKTVEEILSATSIADVKMKRDERALQVRPKVISENIARYLSSDQKKDLIEELKEQMRQSVKDLEFERAAELRDEIVRLEAKH